MIHCIITIIEYFIQYRDDFTPVKCGSKDTSSLGGIGLAETSGKLDKQKNSFIICLYTN